MDPQTQSMCENMLKFVQISSYALKRALDELSVHEQQQKRAASLAQPVLNRMKEAGLVGPSDVKTAAAMLGSHAETLALLDNALVKNAELKTVKKTASDGTSAKPLGRGFDESGEKIASPADVGPTYNGELVKFHGGRRDGAKRASDRIFETIKNEPLV